MQHSNLQSNELTFVSLLATNADTLYQQITHQLGAKLGLGIRVIDTPTWQERAALLASGEVSFGAVCGAVYTRWHDQPQPPVQLLAAPVMDAPRYHHQPVYFSDVVVRRDSPEYAFADLRGKTLVYNEPASYSGYAALCAYLAEIGESAKFFSAVYESGSHLASLQEVLAGKAAATAIDSVVLERACQLDATLAPQLRTVLTIGPSPVPPLVVSRRVGAATVAALRQALLAMHTHAHGQSLLHEAGIERFVAVNDGEYEPIRRQLARAATVQL